MNKVQQKLYNKFYSKPNSNSKKLELLIVRFNFTNNELEKYYNWMDNYYYKLL